MEDNRGEAGSRGSSSGSSAGAAGGPPPSPGRPPRAPTPTIPVASTTSCETAFSGTVRASGEVSPSAVTRVESTLPRTPRTPEEIKSPPSIDPAWVHESYRGTAATETVSDALTFPQAPPHTPPTPTPITPRLQAPSPTRWMRSLHAPSAGVNGARVAADVSSLSIFPDVEQLVASDAAVLEQYYGRLTILEEGLKLALANKQKRKEAGAPGEAHGAVSTILTVLLGEVLAWSPCERRIINLAFPEYKEKELVNNDDQLWQLKVLIKVSQSGQVRHDDNAKQFMKLLDMICDELVPIEHLLAQFAMGQQGGIQKTQDYFPLVSLFYYLQAAIFRLSLLVVKCQTIIQGLPEKDQINQFLHEFLEAFCERVKLVKVKVAKELKLVYKDLGLPLLTDVDKASAVDEASAVDKTSASQITLGELSPLLAACCGQGATQEAFDHLTRETSERMRCLAGQGKQVLKDDSSERSRLELIEALKEHKAIGDCVSLMVDVPAAILKDILSVIALKEPLFVAHLSKYCAGLFTDEHALTDQLSSISQIKQFLSGIHSVAEYVTAKHGDDYKKTIKDIDKLLFYVLTLKAEDRQRVLTFKQAMDELDASQVFAPELVAMIPGIENMFKEAYATAQAYATKQAMDELDASQVFAPEFMAMIPLIENMFQEAYATEQAVDELDVSQVFVLELMVKIPEIENMLKEAYATGRDKLFEKSYATERSKLFFSWILYGPVNLEALVNGSFAKPVYFYYGEKETAWVNTSRWPDLLGKYIAGVGKGDGRTVGKIECLTKQLEQRNNSILIRTEAVEAMAKAIAALQRLDPQANNEKDKDVIASLQVQQETMQGLLDTEKGHISHLEVSLFNLVWIALLTIYAEDLLVEARTPTSFPCIDTDVADDVASVLVAQRNREASLQPRADDLRRLVSSSAFLTKKDLPTALVGEEEFKQLSQMLSELDRCLQMAAVLGMPLPMNVPEARAFPGCDYELKDVQTMQAGLDFKQAKINDAARKVAFLGTEAELCTNCVDIGGALETWLQKQWRADHQGDGKVLFYKVAQCEADNWAASWYWKVYIRDGAGAWQTIDLIHTVLAGMAATTTTVSVENAIPELIGMIPDQYDLLVMIGALLDKPPTLFRLSEACPQFTRSRSSSIGGGGTTTPRRLSGAGVSVSPRALFRALTRSPGLEGTQSVLDVAASTMGGR